MKRGVFLLLGVLVCLSSCRKDVAEEIFPPDCSNATITYAVDVQPILAASCATSGCHNNASAADGIKLEDYADVFSNAAGASFLNAIKHEGGATAMPLGSTKLSDSTITIIETWINEGRCE